MAETMVQNRPGEQEKRISRREESPSGLFNDSPWAMMRRFSHEMNRAFDNVFSGVSGFPNMGAWSPAIEVCERDGTLEVDAELPGLKKDDVKVECSSEGIVIRGEKRQQHEENSHGVHRSERSYGSFYRVIPLPEGAQTEKATAEFRDGMLHVRVPVPENKRQHRQIPIAS